MSVWIYIECDRILEEATHLLGSPSKDVEWEAPKILADLKTSPWSDQVEDSGWNKARVEAILEAGLPENTTGQHQELESWYAILTIGEKDT